MWAWRRRFAPPPDTLVGGLRFAGRGRGWIALRGVLLVRAGEMALLCATFEAGWCTSPARVEGINSEEWLEFLHRSKVTLESGWIARVEGDQITSLTRAIVA